MKYKKLHAFIIFLISVNIITAQLIPEPAISPELMKQHWSASWVTVPGAAPYDYGVYFFTNSVNVSEIPEEFIIHVSADNRYKLLVNGNWIGLGPARSDADNWVYETYNIAPYLVKGENIISAMVWNFGRYKPWAQISLQTGFIVQGDGKASSVLNTPGSWKCMEVNAYEPFDVDRDELGTFIIVGPGEKVQASEFPWDWMKGDNQYEWQNPQVLYSGAPKGVGTDITHALVPRTIPAMELKKIVPPVIRMIDKKEVGENEKTALDGYTIPANTSRTLLLDQQELVTAYPEFSFSGGKDAQVTIGYAESMFLPGGGKPHRDSVSGMVFKGYRDLYTADGGTERMYQPLWFRTYRYLEIQVETSNEALVINHIEPIYTAYPFREEAYFTSSDPSLEDIWETAWRTQRLCANELYYDCPYYEQMQYVGDTRIQALITLYMSGDDRLMRKAIEDYFHSINPEGLTQSRYPTEPRQVIPTYSLFWISMIHDYIMHRNDYLFTARYLANMQHVIKWFEDRVDPVTGMLGAIEYWPFVDWTNEWPWDTEKRIGGVPPGGQEGNSSIITLQFAYTLEQTADIFNFYGFGELANDYLTLAENLIDSTYSHCWNEERGLFSDVPGSNSFSVHANTFAVLSNAITQQDKALFMEKTLRDKSLIQPSLYFRYYVNRAAIDAGLGNKYLSLLAPWRTMLKSGLTTFAEIPDTRGTRSDCHAWSASPLYELLSTVAGIQPGGAGFESAIIEPHPGSLEWLKAGIPHYKGMIEMDVKFDRRGGVSGKITLPEGMNGIFVWDHQTIDLEGGTQSVQVKSLNEKYKLKR